MVALVVHKVHVVRQAVMEVMEIHLLLQHL
jgi:hypothetical protein